MNKQQWTLLTGIGVGAGLMYLLDPQGGRRRRTAVKDKSARAFAQGSDVVLKTSKDVSNRAKGLAASVGSRLHQEEEVGDEVLVARVRSKMGHCVAFPSAIEVTAEEGRVTLRGPVSSHEASRLLALVNKVKGVRELDNQLEVQEGPEGDESLEASGNGAHWYDRLPSPRKLVDAAGQLPGNLPLGALKRRSTVGAALGTVGLGLIARGLATGELGKMLRRSRNGHAESEVGGAKASRTESFEPTHTP